MPSKSGEGKMMKEFKSDLLVGFGMFEERYTSHVVIDPGLSVSATSKETNLLEYLHTQWEFAASKSNPDQCWVNFTVEFQFKSKLYNEFAGIFMNEVVSKMVGAFEERCAALKK
jgi:coenzyme Q-binding protein COQ10